MVRRGALEMGLGLSNILLHNGPLILIFPFLSF